MDHSYVLWIALLAYAIHILEEYGFDWKHWAINVLRFSVGWDHFAVVNGIVIVLGISSSMVGWNCTSFALSLPALMLINGTFFHLLPFIKTKGRFSPGLITSIILFYPIAIWAYYGAWIDGVLTNRAILLSAVIGMALMACPILMLKLRLYPYFNQSKPQGR